MHILLLLSVLSTSLSLSIVGTVASDRFLPSVMLWLKNQELRIDQTEAFKAIQLMFKFAERELQYDDENNEFLQLFAKQIHEVSLQKLHNEQQLEGDLLKFSQEELEIGVSYFKNLIKEKDKLLEQDIKELDKRRKQKKDQSKQENKLKEIGFLISEIEKCLEIGTADKLYGLLEKIESKAVIGLFQYSKEYEEIEQYLRSVDFLFKSRNFEQDKFEIVNLISMVKNVLQDLKLNVLMKLQDDRLEEFEGITFFENSKIAHQQARDYFTGELHQFLGILQQQKEKLIIQWNNFSQMQKQTITDSEQYYNLWQQFIAQNDNIIKKIHSTSKNVNSSLKHLEEQFLSNKQY